MKVLLLLLYVFQLRMCSDDRSKFENYIYTKLKKIKIEILNNGNDLTS